MPRALTLIPYMCLFERIAMEVLRMTQTVKGALAIRRHVKDSTRRIIERAVADGKNRKEPSLIPKIGSASIDPREYACDNPSYSNAWKPVASTCRKTNRSWSIQHNHGSRSNPPQENNTAVLKYSTLR